MRIFSVVGSTGVGKTQFVLELSAEILAQKKYNGIDLISADSRQVYQGLEVISGADVPPEFKSQQSPALTHSFFTQDKIRLHGVSMITLDQEWSVVHFQDLAWEVIELARSEKRLVIMIGGTGLYHQQLQNFDPHLRVKPNSKVRSKADEMNLEQLQSWAQEVDELRFNCLNRSDVNNPRRLVRVIEIGLTETEVPTQPRTKLDQRYVGLSQELEEIGGKIKDRVNQRLEYGAVVEVRQLLNLSLPSNTPALDTLGVSELQRYLDQELSQAECVELWALHEFQYAKRQLAWWQDKQVRWFELNNPKWKQQAFAFILDSC